MPLKREKNVSAKHKSGRKPKLSERPRTLHQIVRKDCRTTALKITSELNEHPQNHLSEEKLQFNSLCFHRQMFQSVWSGVRPIGIGFLISGREYFLWRIVVFLISDNWLSVRLETAEWSVSFKLPSANCEKLQGFCDDLECYFLEIRPYVFLFVFIFIYTVDPQDTMIIRSEVWDCIVKNLYGKT